MRRLLLRACSRAGNTFRSSFDSSPSHSTETLLRPRQDSAFPYKCGVLGAKLCHQLDSVFHQPAHGFRIHLPAKLVMKHLQFGQTREGGCKQIALLGVGPEETHDLVILDRHTKEVVSHVPVQRDEAGVLLGLQAREPVHAAAYATGNVGKVSLCDMEGLGCAVRPILGLSLPDVIIFIESGIQEDTVVPRQLVPPARCRPRTGGTST